MIEVAARFNLKLFLVLESTFSSPFHGLVWSCDLGGGACDVTVAMHKSSRSLQFLTVQFLTVYGVIRTLRSV